MSKMSECWRRVREGAVRMLGDINERTQFHGYWRSGEYIGPWKREYDGKFCYGGGLDRILHDAEQLRPYVRRNEIIGFKHRTAENKPDDPFYGQPPIMLVYSTHGEKERVLGILRSIGVTKTRWIDDDSHVNPLEMAVVNREMSIQKTSSPYSV